MFCKSNGQLVYKVGIFCWLWLSTRLPDLVVTGVFTAAAGGFFTRNCHCGWWSSLLRWTRIGGGCWFLSGVSLNICRWFWRINMLHWWWHVMFSAGFSMFRWLQNSLMIAWFDVMLLSSQSSASLCGDDPIWFWQRISHFNVARFPFLGVICSVRDRLIWSEVVLGCFEGIRCAALYSRSLIFCSSESVVGLYMKPSRVFILLLKNSSAGDGRSLLHGMSW